MGLLTTGPLPALTGTGDRATASTPASFGERELITTPIEELRPGHRVLARNPELGGQNVPPRPIDPELDRLVTFRMAKADGSVVEWDRIESLPELFLGVLLEDAEAFHDLPEDAEDDTVALASS